MGISYQIKVQGHLTVRLGNVLADYAVRTDGVETVLWAMFEDAAEAQTFLILLDDLGINVTEMRQLPVGEQ